MPCLEGWAACIPRASSVFSLALWCLLAAECAAAFVMRAPFLAAECRVHSAWSLHGALPAGPAAQPNACLRADGLSLDTSYFMTDWAMWIDAGYWYCTTVRRWHKPALIIFRAVGILRSLCMCVQRPPHIQRANRWFALRFVRDEVMSASALRYYLLHLGLGYQSMPAPALCYLTQWHALSHLRSRTSGPTRQLPDPDGGSPLA